ncbi:hypothetical protein BKI52_34995 [marine bacterium AO1-C]|nr:hypothetical protein BKI52_34995 [marine bacterium AO1-C]
MDYQTVANKVRDFITFKDQVDQMKAELEELEQNPPKLEKDTVTWEEAIAYSEGKKKHEARIKEVRMGIQTRIELTHGREEEIGKLLPIQDHYILFKVVVNNEEQTFKIGYFPSSYGFRMERVVDAPPPTQNAAQ